MVVAAAGRTTKNELQSAIRTLDHIGGRVLGVILTMLPTKGPDAYGYGNYGAYYGMVQDSVSPERGEDRAAANSKVKQ